MRRRAKAAVGIGAVTAIVALACALALPYARQRVLENLIARCAVLTGGSCEVAKLHLARDGVVATRIRVRMPGQQIGATIGAAAVRFDWWSLVLGRPQGVELRLSNAVFEDDAPLEALAREIARFKRSRGRSGRGEHRFRIDRVEVENASLVARLSAEISARAEGIALQWQRSGQVEAHWRNATFDAGPFTTLQTGECAFNRAREAAPGTVDCAGFATRVDIDSVEERARAIWHVARVLRTALQPAVSGDAAMLETTGSSASALASEPRTTADLDGSLAAELDLRARGGSVTMSHGGTEIVELRPATARIALAHGRVTEAHLRFGEDVTGPAIEADLTTGLEVARAGATSQDAAGQGGTAQGAAAADEPAWRVDVNADELPLSELARWVPGIPWHGIEHGRTRARIHLQPSGGNEVVVVDGELALDDFGLSHRRLSHEPIDGLSVTLRGAARIDLVRRRIETEGIRVGFNGISMALAGWVERSEDHLALDTRFRLPAMSCDSIRRALPRSVTGPVNEFVFAGTLEADVHLALDTDHLATTQLDLDVNDGCAIARDGLVQGIRRFGRPFVQRVQEPHGARAFVTGPGSAAWVAIGEISPYLTRAVVMREDGGFFHHRGFNVPEIRGAIIRDVAARRFVYGASTISMQLAKNVFLAREKTLVRKLQEVALTWYLERSLDKDSILELYLNVVEFGPGIYGIGPAARFFFGREPGALTPLQAIYLSTLLPNPVARFSNFQHGGIGIETLARLRAQARSMGQSGSLSPAEAAFAQTESLEFRPANTPVVGALTYSVDPNVSDGVAEANAPRRAPVDVSGDGVDTESGDAVEQPDRAPDVSPVSLRTGGTL